MKRNVLFIVMALCFGLVQTVQAQIRISEVGYNDVDFEGAMKWVELVNAGSDTVDVTDLILCDFPRYPTVGSLPLLAGNTTVAPGEFVVVEWSDLGDADSEVGLYVAGTSAFGDAENLLDYMQYGEAGHQREGVAEEAGFWTVGAFVENPAAGQSVSLVNTDSSGVDQWAATNPTPGEANAVATPLEDDGALPDRFVLRGNYPNPFNPSTRVEFDLPEQARVSLQIYDALGRTVMVVPARTFAAGTRHTVEVNAATLTSGLYLYQVIAEAAGQTVVKSGRMTLLK